MTEEAQCPNCGRTIPPEAPGGLCPYCLLQLGEAAAEPAGPEKERMGRDRNLLFGVLAIQLHFIQPQAFLDAASAWPADPSRDIADRLVAAGALGDHERELVNGLVEEAIRQHDGDERLALDAFGGETAFPDRGEETAHSTVDREVETKLGRPLGLEGFDRDDISVVTETPGRYTHTSEYRRGGMGRILLVHDEYLSRDIALKELVPHADPNRTTVEGESPVRATTSLVARFLREAKVTGQLEHPAIVPVYELGRRPDGTLYYTMKLVRGQTLAQALRNAGTLPERLTFLSHYLDLCQAIGYAHNRNVIHRDIKPTNVMIGEFGETVVIDWGLAKIIGQEDVHEDDLRKTWNRLRGKPGMDPSQTVPGALLGTPHYMAPEQALGHIDEIDRRSDVFALGVVLYRILAGAVPFSGSTSEAVFARVIEAAPEPIGERAPEAPPELISICEKAMHKDPGKRYQNAKELADDIHRFLTGAVVHAYEYSPREVLARFYRRHRPVINTLATAAIALLALAVYSYVNISIAREHAVIARDEARREAYTAQIRLARSYMNEGNYALANGLLWGINPREKGWEWGHLVRLSNLDRFTYTNHEKTITDIAEVGHENRVVSTSWDDTARVWNAETGEETVVHRGHEDGVLAVDIHPDRTRAATGSADGTVQIWELDTGNVLLNLTGHEGYVHDVAFHPEGALLASGSNDRTIRIWDPQAGEVLEVLEGHTDYVGRLAFTATGDTLISRGGDGSIIAWDTSGWAIRDQWNGTQFQIAGNTGRIAWSGAGRVHVVDIAEDETPFTAPVDSEIRDLAFDASGATLAAACADGKARVWDLDSGALEAAYGGAQQLSGVLFAPGARLVTYSWDGVITLWDRNAGHEVAVYRGHQATNALQVRALLSDGRTLLTGSAGARIKVWDIQQPTNPLAYTRHDGRVHRMQFNAAGDRLLTASWDNTARLIDPDQHRLLVEFGGTQLWPRAAALNPARPFVATAPDDFTVVIWNYETGELVHAMPPLNGPIFDLAFSPNGRQLAAGAWDGSVRVWDANTGEEQIIIEGHTDRVFSVAFSPDGTRLATASADHSVKLWAVDTGAPQRHLEGHTESVYSVAYSPDGRRLVSAGRDNAARVWSATSGALEHTLHGHHNQLHAVTFDPTGARLVTASWDGTARVWDPASGEELLVIPNDPPRQLYSAVFAPDGKSLFLGSHDGRVAKLLTAPWDADNLPAEATGRWQQWYTDYKRTRPAPVPVQRLQNRPTPVYFATTPENLTRQLHALRESLPETLSDNAALTIAEDPPGKAAAGLGLNPRDMVLRINGVQANTVSRAAAALDTALRDREARPFAPLTIELERAGHTLALRYRLVEPFAERRELSLAGADVVDALSRAELDELRGKYALAHGRLNERLTRSRGRTDAENSGVLLVDTAEAPILEVYRLFALAPGDRIVSANGESTDTVASLFDWLDSILTGLNNRVTQTGTYTIKRGEFQTVTFAYTIR